MSVNAGKPSELAFSLSKFSKIPVGTIVFKVKDAGLAYHDFEICTAATSGALKNTCVGKKTKILHPGQAATLTVKITKDGKYEYLCSVPGHAAAGMKGLLGVGVIVKHVPPKPVATTTTATTTVPAPVTTSTTATTGTGAPPPNNTDPACPAGVTIAQWDASHPADDDDDDSGGANDSDGCL